MMILFALALAPGIAIVLYFYLKDQYDREPLRNLGVCFVLGVLSIIPAIIVQLSLDPVLKFIVPDGSVLYFAISAFVIMAAIVSCIIAVRMSFRSIKLHEQLSKKEYQRRNKLI